MMKNRRKEERRGCTVVIQQYERRDGKDRRNGMCICWSQGSLRWEVKNSREVEK